MSYAYDDNPTPSSRTGLWLVLGVVAAILLVCGGVALLGLVGSFWVTRAARVEAVTAELAAKEAADRANQQQVLIEGTADTFVSNFLAELRAGREEAAYNRRTSKGFQARQTLPQFRAFLKQHALIRESTSEVVTVQKSNPDTITVKITVTAPGGALTLSGRLVQENNAWKIDQLTVP
jgi:hypothetical protein